MKSILNNELLKALRAHRSQNQINRKLGLNYNQVSRWETGQKRILWQDFIKLAKSCGCNLQKVFYSTFLYLGDVKDPLAIIKHLTGSAKVSTIAAMAGVSRFKAGRWFSKKAEPTLAEMLSLMTSTKRVIFISNMVDMKLMPSLSKEYDKYLAMKELLMRFPVASGVYSCLGLEQYRIQEKHVCGFVARMTGITKNQESEIIELLLKAGKIVKRNGKYFHLEPFLTRDAGGDFLSGLVSKRYWSARAIEYMEKLNEPDFHSLFQYQVFNTSQKAYEKIIERASFFEKDVLNIIANDQENKTYTKIVNFQIMDLEKMSRS
ncbi:MAG: hypothetical protein HYV97_11785 [Bdellovibrio sp.]|nr:hypothetical protein [Bdellovibrio sp.]